MPIIGLSKKEQAEFEHWEAHREQEQVDNEPQQAEIDDRAKEDADVD